jgi:hypothetical protein
MLPPGPARATGELSITHNVTLSASNLIPLLNDSFTVNAFWLRQWQRVPRAGDRHPKFYNARDNLAEDLGFVPIRWVLAIIADTRLAVGRPSPLTGRTGIQAEHGRQVHTGGGIDQTLEDSFRFAGRVPRRPTPPSRVVERSRCFVG